MTTHETEVVIASATVRAFIIGGPIVSIFRFYQPVIPQDARQVSCGPPTDKSEGQPAPPAQSSPTVTPPTIARKIAPANPDRPHPAPAAIPGELWMLQHESGRWCLAADNADHLGGQTYLVAFSEAEAVAAAKHQDEFNDYPCLPVRVK